MSEQITITCDKCGSKTVPSHRTKIAFGREPNKLPKIDLCGDCSGWLAEELGLVPRYMFPAAADGPGPNDPGPDEVRARAAEIRAAKLGGAATAGRG